MTRSVAKSPRVSEPCDVNFHSLNVSQIIAKYLIPNGKKSYLQIGGTVAMHSLFSWQGDHRMPYVNILTNSTFKNVYRQEFGVYFWLTFKSREFCFENPLGSTDLKEDQTSNPAFRNSDNVSILTTITMRCRVAKTGGV
ncbi:hypothetical protein TNCV_4858501 [Trichonephila clavipes]|nr:hypothetical protein TNCV_4858501 [Trichonephila clavipes]